MDLGNIATKCTFFSWPIFDGMHILQCSFNDYIMYIYDIVAYRPIPRLGDKYFFNFSQSATFQTSSNNPVRLLNKQKEIKVVLCSAIALTINVNSKRTSATSQIIIIKRVLLVYVLLEDRIHMYLLWTVQCNSALNQSFYHGN